MDGSRHRIRHSGESRNPEGEGGTNHTQTLPPTNASNFHTLVCRQQPAWAIGTKACPGLRPGMDGSRHSRGPKERCRLAPCRRVCPTAPTSSFVCCEAGIQGGGWRQPHPNTSSNQVSFSYLGVPAPAGMGDWCESMSRTPPRDGFRHRPATPTTVARTTTAEGRKRDVALGLAPCRRVAAAGRPLSLRPPLRHSGEGRNPGEESAAATNFHTSVCRRQPARAIPMEPCPASTSDRLIATSAEILGLATAKSNPRGRIGRGRGPYQQIEGDESGPSRSPASAPS